jgi:hypothetical protein
MNAIQRNVSVNSTDLTSIIVIELQYAAQNKKKQLCFQSEKDSKINLSWRSSTVFRWRNRPKTHLGHSRVVPAPTRHEKCPRRSENTLCNLCTASEQAQSHPIRRRMPRHSVFIVVTPFYRGKYNLRQKTFTLCVLTVNELLCPLSAAFCSTCCLKLKYPKKKMEDKWTCSDYYPDIERIRYFRRNNAFRCCLKRRNGRWSYRHYMRSSAKNGWKVNAWNPKILARRKDGGTLIECDFQPNGIHTVPPRCTHEDCLGYTLKHNERY